MSHATYVKEFLDAMYVKDFLDYSVDTYDGVTTYHHVYNDGEDEIELAVIVEDNEESFVVTGRQIGADHSFDSEVEIVATSDPIVALNKFEEAIEAITSRI